VHGIANGGSLRMVGRVAVKSLLYFELVTTAALAIGFLGIDLLHPGTGLRLARSGDGAEGASGIAAKAAHSVGLAEFLLAIIPSSPLGGFLHNHILQILLFSVLFGIGLKQTGDIGAPVLAVVNGVARALSALIGMVMKLSPFAAFGALSYTAGEFGLATLFSLGKMVVEFYLACFLFNLPVLLLVSWLIRISLWRRIVFLGEELLLVFGTTSSEMVFLQLVEKQTFLGVEEPVGCRQRIVSTTEEPVSITPQRLYFWLRPPVHRRIRDDSALGSACF
jgi:aerobic C4-dicarboxylate transport protein